MKLTEISLKRPVFATVIILAMLAVGLVSLFSLPINDMPEVEFPYVTISIPYPGASPEQVETKVSQKVEEAVGQISGVKHIMTFVREGYSMTIIEFQLSKSPEVAAQEAKDKVAGIRATLPTDIIEPVVGKFDINAMPILSIAVTGTDDNRAMTEVVNDQIVKRLNTIQGVGSVETFGTEEREIKIKVDKDKLAAFGLTTSEIIGSLKADNMNVPSGKVSSGDKEISLRTDGIINSLEDFGDVQVAKRGDVHIYLKDVAVIEDGIKEKESLSFYQGEPAIGINIIKQTGTNTVQVVDEIKSEIEKIKGEIPSNIKINIVTDNSITIRDSVNDVLKTLIEGSILAVLTVFLFLNESRSTVISAITLPTSMISTFIVMKLLNFSINNLSLMGLSLAIGLLIDDAIVVIENIVRHLRMGKKPWDAAKEGTAEIGLAVTATTLTVVAVFLPVGTMGGIVGQFFRQFGITIAASVLISLFVSFTLVPVLASKYIKDEKPRKKMLLGRAIGYLNAQFDKLTGVYGGFLKAVLQHRLLTIIIAGSLLVLSLLCLPLLGTSFMTATDMGQLTVKVNVDSGLSLESNKALTGQIEEIIKNNKEVKEIYTTVQTDNISFSVKTTDKNERELGILEIGSQLRTELTKIPGIEISIEAGAAMGGGGKTVAYHVQGDDYTELQRIASEVKAIMEETPGTLDVGVSDKPGKAEAKLEIKREAANELGVSTGVIADTIRTLYNGTVVTQFEGEKDRYDVRLILADSQRNTLDSLEGIYIPNPALRTQIPLDQVAEKVLTTSPASIDRYDKAREIQVSCNVIGVSEGTIGQELTKKFAEQIKLPPGYTISAGGSSEEMTSTFVALIIALGLGVLFIFFILAAQFESYIDPFSIMFSLPLALIGAILGLLITGSELSMMSMIGIIMLMGLVTKNAILLIDFAKQERAKGKERSLALVDAGMTRLRPIMMTSIAMILGMLPVALANGSGSELRAPMAHAIIGGLITSTFLTLLVVPVVYSLLDDFKMSVRRLFTKKNKRNMDNNQSISQ